MRAKKSIRAWVARDRSGKIFLYRDKPRKDTNQWLSPSTQSRVYIRIAQYDNQKKLFKQYTHKHQ